MRTELNLYYKGKEYAQLGIEIRSLSVILNLKKRIRQLDRILVKGIERLGKLINIYKIDT